MAEELISELVEFVRTASPLIWQAFYKQVYIEAISNTAIGIVLLIITVILWVWFFKERKKFIESVYARDEDYWFIAGTGFLSTVITVAVLITVLTRFLNPNYYAIMKIIELIK